MNPILISRDRQGGKTYELIQQIGEDLRTDPDIKAVVILHDHQSSHWFLDALHRHLPSHVAERVETAHPGYNRPMFYGRSGGWGYADNVDMIDDGIYHPIFTDLQRSRFELRAITYTPEHGHPGRNYRSDLAVEAMYAHSLSGVYRPHPHVMPGLLTRRPPEWILRALAEGKPGSLQLAQAYDDIEGGMPPWTE